MQSDQPALTLGKQVILKESEALAHLAGALGTDFLRCVDTLLNIKGRVALSGIGKSGHVGRKIAATMTSTGTPAYFIHPVEASHGDLGMMMPHDALIVISHSGDSAELIDILRHAARLGVPIVAITGNSQSRLGKSADILLLLPDVGEACPIACAPTTSTVLSMALGDALAMALLNARGFTAQDFKAFHPGGLLGRKLRLVKDIMHMGDALPLVKMDSIMSDVLLVMTGKGFGCSGVVDAGAKLVGIITDGDLRRHMSAGLLNVKAEAIMTRNPATVNADAPVAKAMSIMSRKTITSLFVTEEQRPVGIIHMHDCLRDEGIIS